MTPCHNTILLEQSTHTVNETPSVFFFFFKLQGR